jgi:hypothetical protein
MGHGSNLLIRYAQLILHDPRLVRLPVVQHPALELLIEGLDRLLSARATPYEESGRPTRWRWYSIPDRMIVSCQFRPQEATSPSPTT